MQVTGFDHIAVLTQDLERFCEFYGELFGAVEEYREDSGPVRMRVLRVGSVTLHPFEVDFSREAWGDDPIFRRGRIDHFGLRVGDEEAFDAIVGRLVERGLTDGTVSDFGRMRSVTFRDPDGLWVEVCLPQEEAGRPWETPARFRERATALAVG